MAVDAEFGLNAEGDEALVELFLDLRLPAGVQVARPELRDMREIDVVIGDNREQLVRVFDIAAVQNLLDDFTGNSLHDHSL